MTNFEKFSKDMKTTSFAVVDGEPVKCFDVVCCDNCDLSKDNDGKDCYTVRMEWLKAEYKEAKIDVPDDTPIDTRVLVSLDGITWRKRYYAGHMNGTHYAWDGGKTSWSAEPNHKRLWAYMKLYNEVEP